MLDFSLKQHLLHCLKEKRSKKQATTQVKFHVKVERRIVVQAAAHVGFPPTILQELASHPCLAQARRTQRCGSAGMLMSRLYTKRCQIIMHKAAIANAVRPPPSASISSNPPLEMTLHSTYFLVHSVRTRLLNK